MTGPVREQWRLFVLPDGGDHGARDPGIANDQGTRLLGLRFVQLAEFI